MGLLITLSYLIPIFGQMALIAFTPMLTFVTLCACRNIAAGKPILLPMWLAPLKDKETRKRLLGLGAAYLMVSLAAGLIATLPFLNSISSAIDTQGAINEEALMTAMRGPFITFALLYVVVTGFFWHAPALIGWHRIAMRKALFYSMVACWRNKLPFLAYGVSWAAIFFLIQEIGGLVMTMGISPGAVQILLTPINIIVAAVLYCSFYPAYISVFGANYDTEH